VTVLAQLDVSPCDAQVALIDATWQDYPQWDTGEEQVVFRAPSLIAPDKPPYPGFAVATQADIGPDGPRKVRVEVWSDDEPDELLRIHQSVLYVGSAGILVGSDQSGGMTNLMLGRGEYALRILVDAETPREVSRVVFVLGEHEDNQRADTAGA
jgi:hypothetical protein